VQQLSDLRKEWAYEILIDFSTCEKARQVIQNENITTGENPRDRAIAELL
jgi:hypothetical protein